MLLASTSNWTRWDGALVVSMWILTFTRWVECYLRQRGMTDCDLDNLSRDAREIAIARPMDEWRSDLTGKPGQLAAFLDQVEGLLAQRDDSKGNVQLPADSICQRQTAWPKPCGSG